LDRAARIGSRAHGRGVRRRVRDEVAHLRMQHDRLRATIEHLAGAALTGKNARGRDRVDVTVRGIAAHDVYHAGQIQLLKRMWKAHAVGGDS
jgi:hypothetical protein